MKTKEKLPFLNGWYFVEWDKNLKKGEVRPLTLFGKKVVLCKSDTGEVNIFDAFCPHLGAHLGIVGEMNGENLVCPFHDWEFNKDGKCVKIPYTDRLQKRANLVKWPVQIKNEIIFIYYHDQKEKSNFEIPTWEEFEAKKGWSRQIKRTVINKAFLQDVVENAVDMGHFHPIHRFDEVPKITKLVFKDHTYKVVFNSQKKILGKSLDIELEIIYHGPGFAIASMDYPFPFKLITSITPIDEFRLIHNFTFVFKKSWNPLYDFIVQSFAVRKAMEDYTFDIDIWANKIYVTNPKLCFGEGPIIKVRNWLKQFEPKKKKAKSKKAA